ncbi:hypothetical protein HHX47_DHR7000607 [Lentinula edodes]|nr:hypothetical protein HHX47_DHR7000607 [Lentinula edodes]
MSVRSAPSTEVTQATDTVIKTIVDLVQHTGAEKLKLVDAKLIPLVQWAKDYAGYRFRHKEIIRILRDEGQLNDLSDQLRKLAEDSLQAGDAFVLARAEADWEGDWVHPRWKKAAMERAQAAEKQRKEDLLVAERRRVDVYTRLRDVCNTNIEDLPFNYSEDSDSEDEILQAASVGAPGPSSSSNSTAHNPANRTSSSIDTMRRTGPLFSNLAKPGSAIPGTTSIVNRAPQAGPDAQQQKRKAEAFLHGDFNKRSRPDHSTVRAALPTNPGVPVPSVPAQHPLLPFNFRGLSKEAQQISNFKQYERTHSGDIVQTLNVHFNGSTNLLANEAYVREISQTLISPWPSDHQMKSIHQTVLPLPPSTLAVHQYPRRIAGHATRALKEASTISNDTGESDLQSKAFGISISQLDNGTIAHIAFATDTAVYLVDADRDVRGNATVDRSFRNFLESTTTVLAGFDMPRIALRLRHHLGHHVRGVDLSTLFSSSTSTWHPSKVVQKLCNVKDTFGVDRLWHENDQDESSVEKLCLRAWISAKVARSVAARQTIESARRVDTRHLKKAVLLRLGSLLRQTDVLARAIPRVTKNEHGAYKSGKKQNMELQNARYKTREDEDYIRPSPKSSRCLKSLKEYLKDLNGSQAEVVKAMTSQDPIVVVHGPPGTGKTTTIASAAEIWSKMDSLPVWIVGHSNVSVKNIAEKLLKKKVDFKLIVSKEFYLEWHEHIYEQISEKLIRTDELPDNTLGMSRLIGSSKVILSTLGLLSNPALEQNGLFNVVPFERLVVDEASQINVFEYMVHFTLVVVDFCG